MTITAGDGHPVGLKEESLDDVAIEDGSREGFDEIEAWISERIVTQLRAPGIHGPSFKTKPSRTSSGRKVGQSSQSVECSFSTGASASLNLDGRRLLRLLTKE